MQVRITRGGATALGLGVFAIAMVSLGISYNGAVEQQRQANQQLTLAEQRIAGVSLRKLNLQADELRAQAGSAEARIQESENSLRQPLEVIPSTEAILAVARQTGVALDKVTSTGLQNSTIGTVPLHGLSLTITVSGETPELVAFVTELSNKFPTGVVNDVSLSIPVAEEGKERKTSHATVAFSMYSY